ncbi:MAG: hypothetical protein LBC97_09635 [Bifidobacteriaceae bacterium]|nr:hypothetical protein [Bifidobacteriaceae bacterium]
MTRLAPSPTAKVPSLSKSWAKSKSPWTTMAPWLTIPAPPVIWAPGSNVNVAPGLTSKVASADSSSGSAKVWSDTTV